MAKSRSKNAVLNIVIIGVMQVASFIYSLVTKDLYLSKFSLSAYGVVDLFKSFFGSLMFVELGFGTILIYNLYKPLARKNDEELRKHLSVFKTIYACVCGIILLASLITLPFIYKVFNISYDDRLLVYVIYVSYLIQVLVKYSLYYKNAVLNASQFKYVDNGITAFTDLLCFIFKVLAIKVFDNIYLFFIFLLLIPSLAYCISSLWVNNNYNVKNIKYASFKEVKESGALGQCKKYIYATFYSLFFGSIDNMLISAILSTDALAYTTNYNSLFVTAWQVIITINAALRGIMADYANKKENVSDIKEVFDVVTCFNFFVTAMASVGFYCLIDDFIVVWIGKEYLITRDIMSVCLIIQMLNCLFEPVYSIFVINGYIFKEKWPLIISALTNFILTIVFLHLFGLIGAYIATIIGYIIKFIGKFYYVLGGIFKDYKVDILSRYLLYCLIIGLEMYFINRFISLINLNASGILLFVYKLVILVLITGIINLIIVSFNKSMRNYFKHTILKK